MNQLKKFIFYTIFSTFSLFNVALAEENSKPLMVIRFNQDFVNYENQLTKVINSAIKAKPSVFLDIVSLTPNINDRSKNSELKKESSYLTSQLLGIIHNLGIRTDRVRLTPQTSNHIKSNEIQIFAR